ncbi:small multi-drug export protein [Pseudoflavonifractor sp. An187]
MDLMQWLTTDLNGEFILTLLVSMIPVVELRGGIPFGVAAGLPVWAAYLAAVIGNLIPVPFIVVYIRRIFMFMRQHMPRLNSVVDKMEQKAHLKSASVLKYQYLGLAIFVAIPLPGTGAWTGALVAAFLDMRLKKAMPSIAGGVLSAGLIISILSYGVKSLF